MNRNNSLCLIIFLLAFPFVVLAQTADDMGKIVVGVDFQDGISQETLNLKPQLEDRLVHFATQAGCSSFDNKAIFISPNIVVNSVDIADGGMKDVYIVKGELFLTIQDRNSGTVFSSKSFPFKGSSTKRDLAVKNGILSIRYENVSNIFSEAKSKILSFYQSRKDIIFARANTFAANGDYDGAIACLMMIPEDLTDLHEQALIKAQTFLDMKAEAKRLELIVEQKNYNDSLLTTANSYLAMHQPEEALGVLSAYVPGNTQQDITYRKYISHAESLMAKREREVKRKEERAYQEYSRQKAHQREMDRQDMALRRQVVSASERLEHHRLRVSEQKVNALKQVACDYIRNNPNRVDYIRVRF